MTHRKILATQNTETQLTLNDANSSQMTANLIFEKNHSTLFFFGKNVLEVKMRVSKYMPISKDVYIVVSLGHNTKGKEGCYYLVQPEDTESFEKTSKELVRLGFKCEKKPLQNAFIGEMPITVYKLKREETQVSHFHPPSQLDVTLPGSSQLTTVHFNQYINSGKNGSVYLYGEEEGTKVILKSKKQIKARPNSDSPFQRQISKQDRVAVQSNNLVFQDPSSKQIYELSIQPYIEGQSLETFEEKITFPIFSALLKSLQEVIFNYLYEKKAMTHRDINPGNITIELGTGENSNRLRVNLVDTDNLSNVDEVTDTQSFYKPYTPPEIFTSQFQLKRPDQTMPWECWSLGCTAFYALCNNVNVFEAINELTVIDFNRLFRKINTYLDIENMEIIEDYYSQKSEHSGDLQTIMFGHALIEAKTIHDRVEILIIAMKQCHAETNLTAPELNHALLEIAPFFGTTEERVLHMKQILPTQVNSNGWVDILQNSTII